MMRSFPSRKDGKQETRLLESNALLLSSLVLTVNWDVLVNANSPHCFLLTGSHPISLTGGSSNFWSFWDSFRSI